MLGLAEGLGLGANDGKALGNREGSCDGCGLRFSLGVGDGCKEGDIVGVRVGSTLGSNVDGLCVGRKDELAMGASEGIALLEGSSEGWKDGCCWEVFLDDFLLSFCLIFFHFL